MAPQLGHNFGLHHAGTVSGTSLNTFCEYCDGSGPMGGAKEVMFVLPHQIAVSSAKSRRVSVQCGCILDPSL
jgi:hypothetical protein